MHWFKTILTVFLLAAFSIPLLSPVLLQVKQVYTQWQMLEALEKQELVHVKIKTSNIVWIKSNKECVLNGEMFDVKHIQIINDETLLTGLYDKKEKEIKRTLEDLAKNQQQSGKLQQLVNLFSVMIANTRVGDIPSLTCIELTYTTQFRNPLYTTPCLSYITPPPKIS
jgi:hypothetical protein